MQSKATSVEGYLAELPEDRRAAISEIRDESCVRFTRLEQVPLDLLAEVVRRVPPDLLIARYEEARAGTRRGR